MSERLTSKQRQFVKDGCIHGDFTMRTVKALIHKGLFHIVPCSPDGRHGFAKLTPLGESVRATIIAKATTPSGAAQ